MKYNITAYKKFFFILFSTVSSSFIKTSSNSSEIKIIQVKSKKILKPKSTFNCPYNLTNNMPLDEKWKQYEDREDFIIKAKNHMKTCKKCFNNGISIPNFQYIHLKKISDTLYHLRTMQEDETISRTTLQRIERAIRNLQAKKK